MISHPRFRNGLPSEPSLREVAEATVEAVLAHLPFWATDLGLHQWDDQMPDLEPGTVDGFARRLTELRTRLEAIDPRRLSTADRADWVTLRHAVGGVLHEIEVERPFEHDPNWYNSVVSQSLLLLARRRYAAPEVRAGALIRRLQAVPRLLARGERLLDNPPAVWVEVALRQFPATLPFLREGLASAFSEQPEWAARVAEAGAEAARAFEHFAAFLADRWRGRGDGDYRLGEARFRQRLFWQEGIDTPVQALEAEGERELARLQEAWQEVAGRLGPGLSPRELMAEIGRHHPPADRLLSEARGVLGELRQFCEANALLTIPAAPDPAVVETPGFLRAITFASIDPPGPFEEQATEAYYQITLPDPTSSPADQEAHLEGYNPWGIRIISAHEVYPGHYVQYLRLPDAASSVRKTFGAGAFVEGWAHYTEELLWEAGYHTEDPDRFRLVQLMEALERVGRYLVAIRMHCRGMTVEEAERFFCEQCFMAPINARREALRGTMDPLYLIYTLGKLRILAMRERARKAWGKEFSFQRFHDALLSHGFPMLPVLEELLFGEMS